MKKTSTYLNVPQRIPVVDTGNTHVTGAIIVRQDSVPTFHLIRLADYQMHNSDRALFVQAMMILDAKVFGYNRFRINSSTALGNVKEVYFSEIVSANIQGTPYNGPCREMEVWYVPPSGIPFMISTYYGNQCKRRYS